MGFFYSFEIAVVKENTVRVITPLILTACGNLSQRRTTQQSNLESSSAVLIVRQHLDELASGGAEDFPLAMDDSNRAGIILFEVNRFERA